jgi:alanine-synthesizing transaminase
MAVFSSRLQWDARRNPLTELLDRKMAEGAPVLDLTESNPTRAMLDYPEDAILAAAFDKGILTYDPDPKGSYDARETVAQYYEERNATVDPSQIVLTASTSEAYSFLFKLLTDPGDEILVPRPSYPLFEYLAAMESLSVGQYPLHYDGQWRIDIDTLEKLAGPRTRAVVLVNPNNPTGSFLKHDQWPQVERFAASRGIAILSDEVFSDYGWGDEAERVASLTQVTGNALRFSMSGLSKVCGLPQMKLGWIVANGPGHEQALNGLEWIADTFLSVATPVQVALPRLLDAGMGVQEQILRRTRDNFAQLRRAFEGDSGCRVLDVEGGWYATLQVPQTRDEEAWALALLDQHDVRVQPGFFYDFASEAFLVLSLLTEPTVFAEGVARIAEFVR